MSNSNLGLKEIKRIFEKAFSFDLENKRNFQKQPITRKRVGGNIEE